MTMRAAILVLSLLLVCAGARAESWTGAADVKFNGYSTLHDFEGTVNGVPLSVVVVQGKEERIVSAVSDAEVARMDTQNADRDKSMRTMLNAAKHRLIHVQVVQARENELRPRNVQGREVPGTMQVILTIAGTRNTVQGAVRNLHEAATQVAFDLAFPVSLKAFGLKPPSALLGVVSVKDKVDVSLAKER